MILFTLNDVTDLCFTVCRIYGFELNHGLKIAKDVFSLPITNSIELIDALHEKFKLLRTEYDWLKFMECN